MQGAYTVILKVNGVTEDSRTVTLAGGTSQDVSFTLNKSQAGTYSISINTLRNSLTVQIPTTTTTTSAGEEPEPSTWPTIVIGLIGCLAGISLAFFVMRRFFTPATFSLSGLSVTPPIVKPGDTAIVSVKVTNIGKRKGTYLINLKINDVTEGSSEVTLAGGDSQSVDFHVVKDNPGIYLINIDDITGRLIVQEPTIPDSRHNGGIGPLGWPRNLR